MGRDTLKEQIIRSGFTPEEADAIIADPLIMGVQTADEAPTCAGDLAEDLR